jgi:hypothetical protein
VAVISGSRGVLVVGGATGDDVVEFLDWEIKNVWRVLGRGIAVADWSTWKLFCLLLADFPHLLQPTYHVTFLRITVLVMLYILLFSLKSYFDDLASSYIHCLCFDNTLWQGGSFAS